MGSLIRYLKGYVRFQAEGSGKERFLNRSNDGGIRLWDIQNKEGKISAYTFPRQYKKLAGFARRSGMQLRVQEKNGFPFLKRKYRKRWGILFGIVFFLAFLLISQSFIWKIEIRECDPKLEQYLLDVLKEHGVKEGALISKLDIPDLQQELLSELNQISWIALNRRGTKIRVEFSEKVQEPQFESGTPCNIVARKTGQIVRIEALDGQTVVKPKQIVSAGDLLISGIVEEPDGSVSYKHALGRVIAQTVQKKKLSISLIQSEKTATGQEKNRYYLNFFGLRFPLFIAFEYPDLFEIEEEKLPLTLFGSETPIGLIRHTYQFYEETERNYTREEGLELIRKGFLDFEQEELADATIISYTEEITEIDQMLSVERSYLCEEDIAQKVGLCISE